jgi:intracellular multiplication protein IcmJ
MHFSVALRTWGQDNPSAALETVAKVAHEKNHGRCRFCQYESPRNAVFFIDRDPTSTQPDNLDVICPVCDTWQHLNEQKAENAVLVYLPEIAPEDLSHLLRTTALALRSTDPAYRSDALRVANWLAAHRQEVEDFWGTSHPGEMGEALLRTQGDRRDDLLRRLQHVALIPDPERFTAPDAFAGTALETDTCLWTPLYQAWLRQDEMDARVP